MYSKLTQPGVGFDYERCEGVVIVKGAAFAVGSVLALDFVRDYATSANIGDASSMLAMARLVYADSVKAGPLVVLQDATAINHSGRSVMVGRTRALVLPSGLSITYGVPLFAKSGQVYLTDDPTNGDRCVARSMGQTSGVASQLLDVEFDGDNGLYTHIE